MGLASDLTGRCDSYCTHGGICELARGHEGQHDSRYCRWDDADALDKDEADRRLVNEATKQGSPELGRFIADWT